MYEKTLTHIVEYNLFRISIENGIPTINDCLSLANDFPKNSLVVASCGRYIKSFEKRKVPKSLIYQDFSALGAGDRT